MVAKYLLKIGGIRQFDKIACLSDIDTVESVDRFKFLDIDCHFCNNHLSHSFFYEGVIKDAHI